MEGSFLWETYDQDDRDGVSRTLRLVPKELWLVGDSAGRSLLYEACRIGDIRAVAMLVQAGANINARWHEKDWSSQRPIETAIVYGRSELVEWLCAAGVHLCPRALCMDSPLDIALYRRVIECARILISNGMRLRDAKYGTFSIDELRLFEKGVLRCRSMAAVMMGVKKHRGARLQHVDRFLIREMALAVWVTRKDDEWQY